MPWNNFHTYSRLLFISCFSLLGSLKSETLKKRLEEDTNQKFQSQRYMGGTKYYPELHFDYGFERDALNPYRFPVEHLTDSISLVLADSFCGFMFPHQGKVNSTFGWRRGRVHSGIDLQIQSGDSIVAAFDGVVRVSKYDRGYGNFVIIRHFNGLETLYGHLKKRDVFAGDTVYAGDLLGLGGSTGRSTGAHLHFETRFLGRPINPELLFDFEQRNLKTDTVTLHGGSFDVPNAQKSINHFRKKKKRGKKGKSSKKGKKRK